MDNFHSLVSFVIICLILFLYCFIGSSIAERFIKMETVAYGIDWFMLPVEIQKDLQFIMIIIQKGVYFRGFGIIHCSLETFTTVIFA